MAVFPLKVKLQELILFRNIIIKDMRLLLLMPMERRKELDVEKDTETALVMVTTDEAETVRVFYRATDLQNVSKWISVLTLILLFGVWIANCTVTIFQKRSKRF